MLVRLTVEYRRGSATVLAPGVLLEVDEQEAADLIGEGRAVPAYGAERADAEHRKEG